MIGTSRNVPDLFWLTRFDAPDPVCAVAWPGGETLLVVSAMELGRARRTAAAGCTVETVETLGLPQRVRSSQGATLAAVLSGRKVKNVSVDASFPVGAARLLEKAGVKVGVATASPFARSRQVKSEAEVRCIRECQRAARAAENALRLAIRASEPDSRGRLVYDGAPLTSERARLIVRGVLAARGALDMDGTIVAGGVQAADPHESGSGPLKTGQTIVADIFPRLLKSGYWGDMTRTHFHGRLSPQLRKMYDAVAEAQKIGIAAVKPGVSGAAVHAAVKDFFERRGFKTGRDASGRPYGFIHSTGHGVGLEIHEEPRLSPSGSLLRPGMVVTVEPGLYYPGVGGVRIEDTVLVVPSGCEIL